MTGRHRPPQRLPKFLRRRAHTPSQPPESPYTEADAQALVAQTGGSEYPPPLVRVSDLAARGDDMTEDDWAIFTRALSRARGRELFPEETT